MKSVPFVLAALASAAFANTAPTVVIQSAAMRPGTTLMDVVYRVNDPDDATVRTRALAFVDGVRSFAKVLRPVTFAEGTGTLLGDAIPANVNHTLTWDVAADWNVDLGQVKFEVLALDGRGLLAIDWITIPAAGGQAAITISKDAPSDASVLNALFWQYAIGDPALTLTNGILTCNANGGNFSGVTLANGTTLQTYSAPYLFKQMNLDPADQSDVNYANTTARAGLLSTTKWHAMNRPYAGMAIILGWGDNSSSPITIPVGLTGIVALVSGPSSYHTLALKSDGTVIGWGNNGRGETTIPAGLSGVTAVSAGSQNSLALKSDGAVVGWGIAASIAAIPAGLPGVTGIASGRKHGLALKSDGTVAGWIFNLSGPGGSTDYGQANIPAGLTGVAAISAGSTHSLALKSDGTVIGWGDNNSGQRTIPVGLSGVTAIAAGYDHSLALKGDGTVVGWGANGSGQTTIPPGLTGVTAISAGISHSLALKSDGTVVGWGSNSSGQTTIPAGLSGVTAIAAGSNHSLALKIKAP